LLIPSEYRHMGEGVGQIVIWVAKILYDASYGGGGLKLLKKPSYDI